MIEKTWQGNDGNCFIIVCRLSMFTFIVFYMCDICIVYLLFFFVAADCSGQTMNIIQKLSDFCQSYQNSLAWKSGDQKIPGFLQLQVCAERGPEEQMSMACAWFEEQIRACFCMFLQPTGRCEHAFGTGSGRQVGGPLSWVFFKALKFMLFIHAFSRLMSYLSCCFRRFSGRNYCTCNCMAEVKVEWQLTSPFDPTADVEGDQEGGEEYVCTQACYLFVSSIHYDVRIALWDRLKIICFMRSRFKLYLAGALNNFLFSHRLGISSSQLTFSHILQRVRYTTKQFLFLLSGSHRLLHHPWKQESLDCNTLTSPGLLHS